MSSLSGPFKSPLGREHPKSRADFGILTTPGVWAATGLVFGKHRVLKVDFVVDRQGNQAFEALSAPIDDSLRKRS